MSADDSTRVSRRGFFKSFLPSLGHVLDESEPNSGSFQTNFIWADLRTGQIGFPLGLAKNDVMPGSIMHLVTATALLEKSLIDPEETVLCAQANLCSVAHGTVDLAHAIAFGCNRYFAMASRQLDAQVFLQYCREFGLSEPLGNFPSGEFPHNYTGSIGQMVIGIDPKLRPVAVQLVRLTALIAARGKLPILHSAEEDVSGPDPIAPQCADATWQFLQEAMHLSCLAGQTAELDPKLVLDPSACLNTLPLQARYASTIIGFFPFSKPTYAFYVAKAVDSENENVLALAQKQLFAQPWP